jgi:hypothetical protein
MRNLPLILALALGCRSAEQQDPTPPSSAAPAAVTSSRPSAAPPPPPEAAAAWQTVKLDELLSTYKDNEVNGDNDYKGKVIRTAGLVGEVKKDITNKIFVTVGKGAMLEIPVVQCFAAAGEEGAAAALKKGDAIAVEGRVEGLMMNVLVKDCRLNPVMKPASGSRGDRRQRRPPGHPDAVVLTTSPLGASAWRCARRPRALRQGGERFGLIVASSRRLLCVGRSRRHKGWEVGPLARPTAARPLRSANPMTALRRPKRGGARRATPWSLPAPCGASSSQPKRSARVWPRRSEPSSPLPSLFEHLRRSAKPIFGEVPRSRQGPRRPRTAPTRLVIPYTSRLW